jgi:hypothetical protein
MSELAQSTSETVTGRDEGNKPSLTVVECSDEDLINQVRAAADNLCVLLTASRARGMTIQLALAHDSGEPWSVKTFNVWKLNEASQ